MNAGLWVAAGGGASGLLVARRARARLVAPHARFVAQGRVRGARGRASAPARYVLATSRRAAPSRRLACPWFRGQCRVPRAQSETPACLLPPDVGGMVGRCAVSGPSTPGGRGCRSPRTSAVWMARFECRRGCAELVGEVTTFAGLIQRAGGSVRRVWGMAMPSGVTGLDSVGGGRAGEQYAWLGAARVRVVVVLGEARRGVLCSECSG
jgi:hypothetical protein